MADAVHSQGPIQAGVRVGELFEEHGRMVYAVCRLVLRDRVEAEDAAQQTFLSAYRSLLRGRGPEQPGAWLATIARNECRRRIEGRAPTAVPISDDDGRPADDPSTIVDRREEIEALCGAIAELPQAQRDAIVLREFYGLSYSEVAAALGLSGPAVESALFKSRRRLQDRLRSLRSAANLAAVPITLHESLARLVPGFAQAGGGATASKLALPVTVKAAGIVAAALAVGGTVTVATTEHHRVLPLAAPAEAAAPSAPAPPARPEASAHQFTPITQPAKRVVAHAFVHPLATTSSESEHQDGRQAESGDGQDGEPADATSSDDHSADVQTIAPAPSSGGTTSEPTRTDDRGDDGGDLTAPSSDDGATPSGGDG